MCFTRQGANKDVFVASSAGGAGVGSAIDTDPGDDYECAWSPDQTKIIYVRGPGNAGQVYTKNSDGSGVPVLAADVAGTFDGNPDWAINFRPACQDRKVSVGENNFAKVPLSCTDQDSIDANLKRAIVSQSGHGSLGGVNDNDDSVIYTPKVNFFGNDSFTFNGSDGNSVSNSATVHITVVRDTKAAKIDKVVVSPDIWRLGGLLPGVLSRAKVGTTISYRLSEKARVTLTFSRRARGRKVGRRCRKPTRKNRSKRRCTRYVKAGTLKFDGKAGTNRVRFQGRLSRRKRLGLGRYRLAVGATDAAANVSKRPRPVAFRIVKR